MLVEPVADANDLSKMTVDVAIDNIWLRLISTIILKVHPEHKGYSVVVNKRLIRRYFHFAQSQ